MLKWQRPIKLTADSILALHVPVERRSVFRQGFFAAYLNLNEACDLKHHEAVWKLLRLRRIPARTTLQEGHIFGDWNYCKLWCKCLKLLSWKLGNEVMMHHCFISFQHMHRLDIRQICVPNSYGVSIRNDMVTDLFTNEAVILVSGIFRVLAPGFRGTAWWGESPWAFRYRGPRRR